ncbi:MAG: hypothetical protein WEB37_08175 [Bacteroidota bacterium]
MKKFIGSGLAFLFIALLFMIVGAISENSSTLVSIGAFWLILAIIMMAKNKQKSTADKQNSRHNRWLKLADRRAPWAKATSAGKPDAFFAKHPFEIRMLIHSPFFCTF